MRIVLIIWFLGFSLLARAQQTIGLKLPPGEKSVIIPFKLINNLIVIPVKINNKLTLNFIVDTGASTSILTEKIFADMIGMDFDRDILISGPGVKDSIKSYVSNDVKLELPSWVSGSNIPMLVLEEDYIQLKRNVGEDIYGIIGYDLFSRFVVEIDYDSFELKLSDPRDFKEPSPNRFRKVPIIVDRTKPYIYSIIRQGNAVDTLKLMIDTGASHALLLDVHKSDVLSYPDTTIRAALGHGLGGIIPGEIGRFKEFEVAGYKLDDILVSIPDEGAYSSSIKRGSRNGTIGGNLLYHFDVILSYRHEALYIRKNNKFNTPFEYDMSGMTLTLLPAPERIMITEIIKGSPADKAGLEPGMVIKRLNWKSLKNSSMSDMYGLLRSKHGKKIRVVVYTEDSEDTEKYIFRLKRLI